MSDRTLLTAEDGLALHPAYYRWAWQMYLDDNDNHWTPNEVQMHQDISTYHDPLVPKHYKETFLAVMAMLTTFDVKRGQDAAEHMMGLFAAPEVKQYFQRLVDVEALHCYAEGTEILTERGWMDFRDVDNDTQVAQWEDGKVTFVRHLGKTIDYYEGDMIRFHNKAMDSLVTPNHWCIGISTKTGKQIVERAEKISLNNLRFPVAPFEGEDGKLTVREKILIAYQADGYKEKSGRYRFGFKKDRKIIRFKSLLEAAKIKYTTKKYNKVTTFLFYCDYPMSKDFSWVNPKKVSYGWARNFVDELLNWDGSRSKGLKRYFSNNESAIDLVQWVSALGGYHPRLRQETGCMSICFVDKPTIHCQTLKKDKVPYKGYVYSVGVPSKTIVVRYNGHVLVSRQTWAYQYCIENLGLDQMEIYRRYKTVPAMDARIQYASWMNKKLVRLQYEKLGNEIGHEEFVWTDQRLQDLLTGVIYWSMCFEGIWFMMSLTGPVQAMARLTGLPFQNTAEQFQYILRDEVQHINFGWGLIETLKKEHPQIWNETMGTRIHDMFERTIELEDGFIDYAMPEPILGYTKDHHKEMTRFIARRRLSQIGVNPWGDIATAKNVTPWLSEMLELKKEKNFFETRVTEYRKLKWDD